MRIDHVGIATRDVAALATLFVDLFDAPIVHEERFEELDVVFLELDDGSTFELLEPVEDGTIDRFLSENGPGIHHVALATDDIDGALDTARDLDVELVDDEPRAGAWGHDVAFCHPRSTGGVLVEFVSR